MPKGSNIINLTGRTFGALTVISRAPKKPYIGNAVWHCRCECGQRTDVIGYKLMHGSTTSCGCRKRARLAQFAKTHGLSKTREYSIWCAMKKRCANSSDSHYHLYGGRGIAVCDQWRNSFETFLRDMGPVPSRNHSIDRIDTDGHYTPENCRWSNWVQQANNKGNNHRLTHEGQTRTITEWERHLRLPAGRVKRRILDGWTTERALTQPVRKQR